MALGDQESTLFVNLAATFLNALCGNQTFGITSGSLGCERPANFASDREVQKYVSDNMDHLVLDVARGQGDSLEALADLMGLQPVERADVYTALQGNFDRIFTSPNVSSDEVVANIDAVLRG